MLDDTTTSVHLTFRAEQEHELVNFSVVQLVHKLLPLLHGRGAWGVRRVKGKVT